MVMEATGVARQLTPDEQQVVGAEVQEARVPDTVLPRIEQPEKRETPPAPLPRAPMPPPAQLQEEIARQTIFGIPIARVNRYEGTDTEWRPLLRWAIPPDRTGDLHEIAVLSNNDEKTRLRLVFAGADQGVPEDRQTSSPLSLPWRGTVLPPNSSIVVEVRSTDGTSIIVDATLTGTER